MNIKRQLARLQAPDEHVAQERAWEVVRAAYREREIGLRTWRVPRWGLVLAPATAAVVGVVAALTLTPAGATMGRLISQAFGVPHAARSLFSLPAPGRLLVSGAAETWIVSSDGSRRRLGSWRQASWSPHGIYLAVASGDRLAAVNPRGVAQWALIRPGASDPRWYAPTGYRIAYRSAGTLRVVAGDGTGDHLLATGVSPVAPAWRPGHAYQLAYVQHDRVVLRDADSGHLIWTRPARAVRKLGWSADGTRLLIITRTGARIVSAKNGHTTARINAGRLNQVRDGSLSPDGRTLALVTNQGLSIAHLGPRRPTLQTMLPGAGVRQVTWSPNGQWLLASWPPADQWVFIATGHRPRIAAVSRIAQQFSEPRTNAFPQVDGWCCTVRGSPS
ncbi:MAG: WD40 repeat domain-containing protein [Solirubrobacteraceae bacterium]